MTKLLWDQAGEKLYETGLDRGVLYLSDDSGIPWNGLTSIDEGFDGDSTTPVYFDGVKRHDAQSYGDFAATLTAFTYPDEFLDFEGVSSLGNGLLVDGQNTKTFGLSYRTLIGNDTVDLSYGYEIHVLYDLTAAPNNVNNQANGSSTNILEFSWKITGRPKSVTGYRPTAHIVFRSPRLSQYRLQLVESLLYGSDISNARLPSIDEFINLLA